MSADPSVARAELETPSKPSDEPSTATNQGWRSGPAVGVCSTLVAGLVVWGGIQWSYPVFATTEGADEWGFLPLDVQWALDRNNSMFVIALLAGVAAAALAVGEGLCRRAGMSSLTNAAKCAAVAVLFGGLAGFLGHRTFELLRTNHELQELTKAMCVFGVMFATAGSGVGLSIGVFFTRNLGVFLGVFIAGALAGLVAAILYPILVAFFLPGALTSVLIPIEPVDRILWVELAMGSLGLLIPGVARHSASPAWQQ